MCLAQLWAPVTVQLFYVRVSLRIPQLVSTRPENMVQRHGLSFLDQKLEQLTSLSLTVPGMLLA